MSTDQITQGVANTSLEASKAAATEQKEFGTRKIDEALLERFEKLTGWKPASAASSRQLLLAPRARQDPRPLRAGQAVLPLHRPWPQLGLDAPRSPHPFLFTKWLQDVFDCPLVIQLTDDEKFSSRPTSRSSRSRTLPSRTRVTSSRAASSSKRRSSSPISTFVGGAFYANIVRISRMITINQSKGTFGFTDSDSVGKTHFVSIQARTLLLQLVPADLWREARHPVPDPVRHRPGPLLPPDARRGLATQIPQAVPDPLQVLPALQGSQTKMSASAENSSIFMHDTPNQIKNKINKHAFSGGQETAEEQRRLGGNPDVDVAYQYLTFFLDDDAEIERIATDYRSGAMLTGELKQKCIAVLQKVVSNFQQKKAAVSDELVREFMNKNRSIDPHHAARRLHGQEPGGARQGHYRRHRLDPVHEWQLQ
ncbi:hypothetical protein L1887_51762 [Cichorium endivia]|nr:hypothetical protein L1887_51762 [Cichorium endivia]